MFVGHYGPGFAIKAARPSIPLGLLFVAVQLVDVAWSILVLLGVEKVRIVPGITASNPLDLYYMPYTHGLLAAAVWAGAAIVLCRPVRGVRDWTGAAWVGVAVFSHWVLDLLVHRPDLPLWGDSFKVGFGLWNHPAVALSLETFFLFGGLLLYMRRTKPLDGLGRLGPPVFCVVMLALHVCVFFGPPPVSARAAAITALVAYVVLAAVAQWLDGHRAIAVD